MMSGHTLLKILVGFLWVLYISFLKGLLPIIFLIVIPIPFIAMIIIFILECAVAFLQAYVFLTLVTIYLNDGINLH
jgi:F-type H+-transporting ATPase subunit a